MRGSSGAYNTVPAQVSALLSPLSVGQGAWLAALLRGLPTAGREDVTHGLAPVPNHAVTTLAVRGVCIV